MDFLSSGVSCCGKGARALIDAGIDVRFYNFPLCAVDPAFGPSALKALQIIKFDMLKTAPAAV